MTGRSIYMLSTVNLKQLLNHARSRQIDWIELNTFMLDQRYYIANYNDGLDKLT